MIFWGGNVFLTAEEIFPNSMPLAVFEFSIYKDFFKLNFKKISSSGIF